MITRFPHCDSRILHAPGECEYCDQHPEWQQLRMAWGICFTGHDPEEPEHSWLRQLPCPADFNRPPGSDSDHRRWGGNRATGSEHDETPVVESEAPRLAPIRSVAVSTVHGLHDVKVDGEKTSNVTRLVFDATGPFVRAAVSFIPEEVAADLEGRYLVCERCGAGLTAVA